MSQWISFASGSSSPANPDNTYETLGYAGTGALTAVISSASANTKGNYVTIGTSANNWSGFWLIIGQGDNANARVLADVSVDNGSTVKAPNIYAAPGTAGNASNVYSIFLPLNVTSGSVIRVRTQSSTGNLTAGFAVRGVVTNANSPPCFNTMTALTADTTNTRASTVSTALTSSVTWTQQVASTAATYGAMFAVLGTSTVDPSNQDITLALATGASSSEVEFWRQTSGGVGASIYYRSDDVQLIERSTASGTRLSATVLAATPGTSTACVGLYGFS